LKILQYIAGKNITVYFFGIPGFNVACACGTTKQGIFFSSRFHKVIGSRLLGPWEFVRENCLEVITQKNLGLNLPWVARLKGFLSQINNLYEH